MLEPLIVRVKLVSFATKSTRWGAFAKTCLSSCPDSAHCRAMLTFRITEDDLTGPAVAALLQLHLDEMHRWSPPASVHAMPLERLRAPDVTFYAAWHGAELAACGALKALGAVTASSNRCAPPRPGVGAARAGRCSTICCAKRGRAAIPGSAWKPGGPLNLTPRASFIWPMALPNVRHLQTMSRMTSVFV